MKPIEQLEALYLKAMGGAHSSSAGVILASCWRRYMRGEISEDEAVCGYMQAITLLNEENFKMAVDVLSRSTQRPLITP